jgi:hypothetical protein
MPTTPEGGQTSTSDPVKPDKELKRGDPTPGGVRSDAGSNPPPSETNKGDKGK